MKRYQVMKKFGNTCGIFSLLSSCLITVLLGLSMFKAQAQSVDEVQAQPVDIRQGAEWKYFKGVTRPPFKFSHINFDDSKWLKGKSNFGYGNIAGVIHNTKLDDMRGRYRKIVVRRTFTIDDCDEIEKMFLKVKSDGAFIAYLNGIKMIESEFKTDKKLDLSGWCHELLPGTNVITIEGENDDINSRSFQFLPEFQVTKKETKEIEELK